MISSSYIPVAMVGGVARRALAAEQAWWVVAVFRRSFYCRSARGALIMVGPEVLGAGPLHVLWARSREAEHRLPEVGTRVGIDFDRVSPDATAPITLGLRAAREWRPPPAPRWEPSRLRASLASLGSAADGAPAEGVGQLIEPLAASAADPGHSAGGASLNRLAWPALAALTGWVRRALARSGVAEGTVPTDVDRLIGLGPGLTPSGDDVLAGALLALHAFARADVATELAAWLGPRAAGRTGFISLAHLECAACGEGAAVLHDALTALASGDPAALARSVGVIGTLGHSSGWDALTGIVAVAAAWCRVAVEEAEVAAACR